MRRSLARVRVRVRVRVRRSLARVRRSLARVRVRVRRSLARVRRSLARVRCSLARVRVRVRCSLARVRRSPLGLLLARLGQGRAVSMGNSSRPPDRWCCAGLNPATGRGCACRHRGRNVVLPNESPATVTIS